MTKSIGILGGVGAIASARFHLDLVTRWAEVHDAKTDEDFPEITHVSMPLGLSATGWIDENATGYAMTRALKHLSERTGPVAVVCNSITRFLPHRAVFDPFGTRFLTPVAACREALVDVKTAWLLASESTIRDRIYQEAYPFVEWKCLVVTAQIQQVISGQPLCIHTWFDIPAGDTIVLGCTELSTIRFARGHTISPTDEMIRLLCHSPS